jgi:hypothetical protein
MKAVLALVRAATAAAALTSAFVEEARSADMPSRWYSPERRGLRCKCPKPKPETCEQTARRLEPIGNTIETTVLLSFVSKSCFLPDKLPRMLAPGQSAEIHLRHVFNNNLFVPFGGRELRITVIDSFGYSHPRRILNVDRVRSTNTGFPDRRVFFRPLDEGVYRIRVDYIDRDTPNFVMSPNIIVTGRP